jgi:phosphate-selective porin OprO and OprP
MGNPKRTLGLAASLVAMISSAAEAQSPSQSSTDSKIAALERQVSALERELKSLRKQAAKPAVSSATKPAPSPSSRVGNANAAIPVKNPVWPSDVVVKLPNNRPTICTADNLNCIALTSRFDFDVGGYQYRPNSALTNPQQAEDGVNARRARIGVLGTLMGAWDYGLIYDFGGTQDGKPTLLNAYLTYTGIKDLYVEGGYIDVPYTLDEATSSKDVLFMERSTAQTVAKGIAAGNRRAAFGAHGNGDWWWLGSYVTGPTWASTTPRPRRSAPPPAASSFPSIASTARSCLAPMPNSCSIPEMPPGRTPCRR